MPRVDFYVLPNVAPKDRWVFACRLTRKAYLLGHPVYLHTSSSEKARYLDELLWTYQADHFIPHGIVGDQLPPLPPILIGDERGPSVLSISLPELLAKMYSLIPPNTTVPPWENQPVPEVVLINLDSNVPPFFEAFGRVSEIVNQEDQILREGRARFSYYRSQGISPNNHKL